MKKIFAIFTLLAGVASAQSFIRTHTIVSDNSTFPSPANVEWMSGESVRFEITAKNGNFYIPLSNGVAPVLKMWSGSVITQLYAQKTGTIYSAGSGKLYVDLLANEANITPTGAYNYAIGVYDGTQYMGVVAQGRATIRGHPFGASVGYVGSFNAFPYVPSNDAAYLNAITNIIAGTNITVSRSGRQVTVNSSASASVMTTQTFAYGQNKAGRTVTNGTAVKITSDPGGTSIRFDLASATNTIGRGHFLGLVSDATITNNGFGNVICFGQIGELDTSPYDNGQDLYLNGDGQLTNVAPVSPAYPVHIGYVVRAHASQGVVFVHGGHPELDPIFSSVSNTIATNVASRLASNVWAAANSTTNYVRRNGDTMTSALKMLRTNDIGLTFGAFGTRNSILGVGQNDALGSGLTFVPHTANPQVPVWTLGGVYDVSSGVMYGTAIRGSGLGEIDGTIGAGDFFRLEFVGADSVTQRMLTVSADALGATGSSALLSISNATFSGNGAGLTNVTAYQLGDIRIYGAVTNSDATAAIASALAINNSVFIPAGTWTVSNIVIAGTKTIYGAGYESRIAMAASATGALINAAASGATVRVRGLSLSGGSEISRATNTAAGSRHGVQYATQDNLGSRFNQMWISGFTGYGIYGNEATYTGNLNDALRISEVTVSNCYGGIVTAGRSELVSVTDCFAGYNAIGFRAGAGNTQIKGCTAANNGIDYDVTAAGANDAHGIINDCKAISVPARYTVRVSTNTQGFVFSGNSFYHGGILLEASKGALFVGNQISATFVADRGGGSGTNFFINNIFGTGDANVLSNSANTIYHAGNYDINGNRMWSEVEPLYGLPSSISATQLTAGTIATAIDGRNITNITAASTSGVSSISATGAVSGAIVFQGSGVTQSGNTFTFTGGTGGTASASSIVAAWAVNVYQAPISTQASYIKINFTNVEYNLGSVYNPTNFNLTLPTGWVSMAIMRSVASQNARMIVPLYKNGSEFNASYGGRFYDDIDGSAGSVGGSTHPMQFFNDSATNVFSVYCWWNATTRTNASFRWSGSVQN